jgi:hypothetical protein
MKSPLEKEKRPLASKTLSNGLRKTSQVVVRSQECLDQRWPICVWQTLIRISDGQLRASALTKTLKSNVPPGWSISNLSCKYLRIFEQ